MQDHSFTVTIQAYNRAEAESKLELLMQMGAFLSDFNVADLAGTFLKYQLLHYAAQLADKQKAINYQRQSPPSQKAKEGIVALFEKYPLTKKHK